MTRDDVDRAIAQLRAEHPELGRPVTWHGLRAVLKRERIWLTTAPLDVPAMLLSQFGYSVIVMNAELVPRDQARYAAHELAHVKLHVDGSHEPTFDVSPCSPADPREREAIYFATSVLLGPALSAPWPEQEVRRAAAGPPRAVVMMIPRTIPAKPRRARRPYLERPSDADDHITWAMRYAAKHPLRIRRFSEQRLPRMEQLSDKTCYFLDEDGRRWRVHDVAVTGRGRVQRLELMSDWSTYRVFVPKEGPWRWYAFVRREGRGLSSAHLAQQWEAAELRLAGAVA
jgi:hypothetical protein